jgi:hypothetical protein
MRSRGKRVLANVSMISKNEFATTPRSSVVIGDGRRDEPTHVPSPPVLVGIVVAAMTFLGMVSFLVTLLRA